MIGRPTVTASRPVIAARYASSGYAVLPLVVRSDTTVPASSRSNLTSSPGAP